MYDYVIVGSGIGGSLSYAILKKIGRKVALLEKENYLGGCSGTFKRKDFFYNVGATTLVGLDDSMPLGKIIKFLGVEKPPVKKLELPIVVYLDGKVIKRYSDKQKSLEEIAKNFPYKNIESVWKNIYHIAENNWKNVYKLLPINFKNPSLMLKKIATNRRYLLYNLPYQFKSTYKYFKEQIPSIDKTFKDFIDHQILITSQGYSQDVPISVGSMGLTYNNLDNYYVYGGMGKIFDSLIKEKNDVFLRHKVLYVKKMNGYFEIKTNKNVFYAKKVILNKTIWDYAELLEPEYKQKMHRYRKKYPKRWYALTIYFSIEDKNNLIQEHHYQIIHEKTNPYTGSNSFFISLSDYELGEKKSVTISTHCKNEFWENLEKNEYYEQKEKVQEFMFDIMKQYIPAFKECKIENVMVGTPITFERYTQRYSGTVGGIPLIKDYIPFRYPSNFTEIEGLYLVGDSVFPGQGWPGVSMGVLNLLLQLENILEILD